MEMLPWMQQLFAAQMSGQGQLAALPLSRGAYVALRWLRLFRVVLIMLLSCCVL